MLKTNVSLSLECWDMLGFIPSMFKESGMVRLLVVSLTEKRLIKDSFRRLEIGEVAPWSGRDLSG